MSAAAPGNTGSMKEFDDILIDGETITWSSVSDPSYVKARQSWFSRKREHAAWLLLGVVIIVGCAWLLGQAWLVPYAAYPLKVVIAVTAVFFAFGCLSIFDGGGETDDLSGHRYLVTDRRLVIADVKSGSARSFAPKSLLEMYRHKDRQAHHFFVSRSHDDGSGWSLTAVDKADELEKLLIERFLSEGSRHEQANQSV